VVKTDTVLAPLLKQLGIEEGVRLERLRRDWQEIFHGMLAAHMAPHSLAEGELLLHVASPIWIQQLTFFKPEILSKLQVYGVRSVRFRVGRMPRPSEKKPGPRAASALTAQDIAFVESLLSEIDNDELKEAVRRAIEKSLASPAVS
jgi:hypothetical protein